ncbi:MAG TPA: hypothetical protein VF412_18560 [Bdellovibrio sp.]|uniref:hypothetical protein n=1 Tax=Bdellovibrio sp. TaxID=28201 RepID=UPI002F0C34A0
MKYLKCFGFVLFLGGCSKTNTSLDLNSGLPSLEGGAWQMDCSSFTGYEAATITYAGGSYQHLTSNYSDASCAVKQMETVEQGTYQIGDTESGTSMVQLDRTLSVLTIKPLTAAIVSQLNSQSFCGINSWTLNFAQDVTGRNCSGVLVPSAGATYYDIYSIASVDMPAFGGLQATSRGDLTFGYNDTSHDGSTPSERPNSLSGNYVFRKQ